MKLVKYAVLSSAVVMLLAPPAFAEDPPAGGMDMSKMGPWTRKPTNEKKTKAEVIAFFKAEEGYAKTGNFDGHLALVDFPLVMFTDDAKGVPESDSWDRERYSSMMKPFWENKPKDMKTTHKPAVTVLSDSLVTFTDDFTMTMGKVKLAGKNTGVLVKRDGTWKWKIMGEAGWGGMGGDAAAAPKAEAKPDAKAEAKPAAKK